MSLEHDEEQFWYWYPLSSRSKADRNEMRKLQLVDALKFGLEVPEFESSENEIMRAACNHLKIAWVSLRAAWQHVKDCERCLKWAREEKQEIDDATDRSLRAGGSSLEEHVRRVTKPRLEELRKQYGILPPEPEN